MNETTPSDLTPPDLIPPAPTPRDRSVLAAGLLYLATFAASIPAVVLLGPVLDDPAFVLGTSPVPGVVAGALLDLVNAAACVGTAVVLYPRLRPFAPRRALGFVTTRVLEAAIIVMGVVAVLAVVSLRQRGASGPAAQTVAAALVALRDWTFLLGPGLMPAANAVLLGSTLLGARLVPRFIPLLGLVGAPVQFASVLASLFGLSGQVSVLAAVAVLPIFLWELSLGLWLTFRGLPARNLPPLAALASLEAEANDRRRLAGGEADPGTRPSCAGAQRAPDSSAAPRAQA